MTCPGHVPDPGCVYLGGMQRVAGHGSHTRRPFPYGNQFRCLSNVPARTGDDVPQGILWRHSDRADRGMSVRYSEIWPRVGSSVFTA